MLLREVEVALTSLGFVYEEEYIKHNFRAWLFFGCICCVAVACIFLMDSFVSSGRLSFCQTNGWVYMSTELLYLDAFFFFCFDVLLLSLIS